MADPEIQRLRRKLNERVKRVQHEDEDAGRTGALDPATGDPYLSPVIGAPANMIMVRVGAKTRTDPGRSTVAVWNNNRVTTLRADVPVELDRDRNGDLFVVGPDKTAAASEFPDTLAALFPSADPAPEELSRIIISRRNISDFRPRVADSGGLALYVAPGWYRGSEWTGDNFNFSAHVTPTSGKYAYIVIGFDEVLGQPVASTGTDYNTAAEMDRAEIATIWQNTVFANARPIASIPVANGATTFLNADIIDIRDLTSTPARRRDNATATGDPTASDDISAGYDVFSHWLNTSDGGVFICVDPAEGAAVWNELSFV